MRAGIVFRSSQLSELTDPDQDALLGLGITDVFDLRTADEARRRPDRLPAGARLVLADVLADRPHSGAAAVATLVNDHADKAAVEEVNAAVGEGRARDLMIETYRHLVSLPSAHEGYRRVLVAIADSPGASVVHCTAGKDRSGWAIAVLQRLAGTQMDDVVADYLGSNAGMVRAFGPMLDAFAIEGGDAESLSHMIYVRPEYLDAAVTLMHHVYGGLDGYLETGLGLQPEQVRALRARLDG
jgi:protein-tyrosine phosphatase